MSHLRMLPLVALLLASTALAGPGPAVPSRLAAARRQVQHAQELESKLEAQVAGQRTAAAYLEAIKAYRRVSRITPASSLVAPSLVEIGRLYSQMGRLFDSLYFQKAADAYHLLVQTYPHSRLVPEALFYSAKLEEGPLAQPALARKTLLELVAKYPSSDQADAAQLELASTSPASAQPAGPPRPPAAVSPPDLSSPDLSGGEEGPEPALIRSVASRQEGRETDIRISLSGPVKYRSARIARPDRVYFDLSRAYLASAHGETLALPSRIVKSVRVAQNLPRVVRVVLEVAPGAACSATLENHPYRLLIRVAPASSRPASARAGYAAPGGVPSASPPSPVAQPFYAPPAKGELSPARPLPSGEPSLTRALGLKIDRIVIDPGHGGFDTGTIGPDGLEEKTVCLDIARRLGRLIEEKLPDTQVIYTRDSDVYVPLAARTRIANQEKADLFISIHANSSPDDSARGVESYFLNFTTSPQALAVAARENALAQQPVHQLQSLLQKISLNDKIDESRAFASDVDRSLVGELRLGHVRIRDRGAKKAPFVVLIGARMPSILVEVSFLSNPADDELLGLTRYRQRVALGLFEGVRSYLSNLNSLASSAPRQTPASEP